MADAMHCSKTDFLLEIVRADGGLELIGMDREGYKDVVGGFSSNPELE